MYKLRRGPGSWRGKNLRVITLPRLPPSSGLNKEPPSPPRGSGGGNSHKKHEVPRLSNSRAALNKGSCVFIGHKKSIFLFQNPEEFVKTTKIICLGKILKNSKNQNLYSFNREGVDAGAILHPALDCLNRVLYITCLLSFPQ
jgi:hypothetical protein